MHDLRFGVHVRRRDDVAMIEFRRAVVERLKFGIVMG